MFMVGGRKCFRGNWAQITLYSTRSDPGIVPVPWWPGGSVKCDGGRWHDWQTEWGKVTFSGGFPGGWDFPVDLQLGGPQIPKRPQAPSSSAMDHRASHPLSSCSRYLAPVKCGAADPDIDRWVDLSDVHPSLGIARLVGPRPWIVIFHQDPYFIKVSASNGDIPLQRDPDVTSNIEVPHRFAILHSYQSLVFSKTTVGETWWNSQKKIQHVLYFHAPVPAGATEPPGSPRCATSRPYLARVVAQDSWGGYGQLEILPTKWRLQPANH